MNGHRIAVLTTALSFLCSQGCASGGSPRGPGAPEVSEHILGLVEPPEFSQVSISPDGEYIGALVFADGQRTLSFFDRASLSTVGAFRFAARQTAHRYAWVGNRRVVIELAEDSGERASAVRYGEIYAVDVDGKNPKMVFGHGAGEQQTGTRIKKARGVRAWGEILDPLVDDEDHFLVKAQPWERSSDLGTTTRVYRVDVRTGLATVVGGGPGVVDWYLTVQGEPRIAFRHSWIDRTTETWVRNPGEEEWRPARDVLPFSDHARPIFVSASGKTLYVFDRGASGNTAIKAIALDGSADPRVVVDSPAEPLDLLRSADGERPIAVEIEPDYPTYLPIEADAPVAQCRARVAAAFPSEHTRLVDASRDGRYLVVGVVSDRNAGRYYVADCQTDVVRLLFAARGRVDEKKLGATEAIRIEASDGFILHGYLTLPAGQGERGLPLVVLPHGGPHGVRDRWELDPVAQLLASSGYAVLRVNFRGSGGYGEAYERAGYRHWGDRVIDDIIDATRWTIQEGIADPARIGIAGFSFGAFAAASSAIRAPGLFQCVVGHSGLYDMSAMYEESDVGERRAGRDYLEKVLGAASPELSAASPIGRADEMTVPVLLLHGEGDRRTPLSQAERFRDALEAAKKPVRMVVYDRGDHGFSRFPQRLASMLELVRFLDEHLKR